MAGAEMPIFSKTFDFLTWILPMTNHFPRAHRHTATKRLLDASFDLRELLESANAGQGAFRIARLQDADEALGRVRLYVRLAWRWGWMSEGQYEHAAKMLTEIGRLLGGWQRVSTS